jgi:predicted protein tyrosine phosphatase
MFKVLFVCEIGLHRSPTFADVGTRNGLDCRSCGVNHHALIPITIELMEWADVIVFLQERYYQDTNRKFWLSSDSFMYSKCKIYPIDDVFERNDPWLVTTATRYIVRELLKGN